MGRGKTRQYWELFDNGCYHYPDCETCPFQDCILSSGEAISGKKNESQKNYIQKNRAKLNTKSKEYYRKKRKEDLKKEFPFLDLGGT